MFFFRKQAENFTQQTCKNKGGLDAIISLIDAANVVICVFILALMLEYIIHFDSTFCGNNIAVFC